MLGCAQRAAAWPLGGNAVYSARLPPLINSVEISFMATDLRISGSCAKSLTHSTNADQVLNEIADGGRDRDHAYLEGAPISALQHLWRSAATMHQIERASSEAISSRPFTGYSATSGFPASSRASAVILHRPQNEEVHQHVQQYEHPQNTALSAVTNANNGAVCAGQPLLSGTEAICAPMTSFNAAKSVTVAVQSTIVAGAAASVE
jgi:hypothetical protein